MNKKTSWQILLLLSLVFALKNAASAGTSEVIGSITFQIGETRLERNGQTGPLVKGQALKVGDRLLTGADGHVHAIMADNGFISVRPASRLHIQAYTYAPHDPTANRVGLLLESGVARTISGKAGEAARESYRFNTPVAAIGLRGTDYVVQALPDLTRVSVLKGAVTLSAYGPNCLAGSLGSCAGPLVRELSANIPHAYMEVRAAEAAVIITPENAKDAPSKIAPPRPEELAASGDRRTNSALVANALPTSEFTAPVTAPVTTPVTAPASNAPEARSEIVWGRWSNVPLQGTPTLLSLLADDREITFSNALFGLLRPSGTPQLPGTGVIAMNYARGEAYLQGRSADGKQTLTPATLSQGKLQLDFNSRQFSTSLNAAAEGVNYALQAQGTIQFQGMLYSNPTRSNMDIAGTLSNNANEAGYLFQSGAANNQQLIGATHWKR